MTWSRWSPETMYYKCKKKKNRSKKRTSWNGKSETLRKSMVSWKLRIIQRLNWEEETRYSYKYINFECSITQAFFKNMEKFTFWRLDQILWCVIGSFEFLTWSYFLFSGWLNSRGVSYQGGTALWSWRSSLFQKAEVVGRSFVVCCLCDLKLNVLSRLGGFWRCWCSEMDKVESRCSSSAPFPDSGLVVSMTKNWFT